MRIAIDARLYGPKHTGPGRYTMKLVENLAGIDRKNEYLILLRKENFQKLVFPENFKKVLADFNHYSFEEQFKLPLLLVGLKPDIVHFPFFNVPVFYFGRYIVTIHDLIMHKFKGKDATTRAFPIYFVWRLGYHLAFAKAVYGSCKIITPSFSVRDEIVNYYHINRDKVSVTYE